ncbi:cupin domain-containing protein [uncultured Acidaminococcus sp.]|uniref:cupin domain-containing protein n=1 Tax=uncultured Acidaminococcus sp. TaxID=352152 RepID=UPI002941CA75|nr:cupin domain-containing protein [uncultured Acidaminococcus sp.]
MAVFTKREKKVVNNPGTGTIEKEILMDPSAFQGNNDLFAQITLHPGCAVPVHQHLGNNETYYLLQGEGEYTDEDKKLTVKAGDVTFCADGGTHGLKNTGKEDLVFIALICNTPGYKR